MAQAMLFMEPWLAELAAKREDRAEVRRRLESTMASTDAVRGDPEGIVRAAMVFAPATMADALMVECAAAATAASFKWCRECGSLFTGKKASAQFCSTTCKDSFHNRRRLD